MIARTFAYLNKPEYLLRPTSIRQRLKASREKRHDVSNQAESMDVTLPVGLQLRCRVEDTVGGSICRCGIYDLAVSEAIWRLLEPGETAVDVGANIGYMTALMARKTGKSGLVHGFEPHPILFSELKANVARWPADTIAKICLHEIAISDINGTAKLVAPESFTGNRGTSFINREDDAENSFTISTSQIDSTFKNSGKFGLLKVDVEGHEPAVFRGASDFLDRHHIRDIIFEEHGDYPTTSSRYLEEKGYHIFGLEKGLLGPVVISPTVAPSIFRTRFDPRNLIATSDPDRLMQCMRSRGYQVINRSQK